MIGNREQQPRYQSIFYRDYYHKLLNALMISCFIVLVLIATIIYLLLKHPSPHYYGTSLGGQIIPMTPIVTRHTQNQEQG